MNSIPKKILVLGMGNDIMGDDAAGLVAARRLEEKLNTGGGVDFCFISSAGFILMDVMEGYDKVLVLDSVLSGEKSAGDIRELDKSELMGKYSGSPHYTGLPEIIELAKRLELDFPDELRALVIGINEKGILRESLSSIIEEKIPLFTEKAAQIINSWQKEPKALKAELLTI
jgi:hydrogenase maturation protease